MKAWVAALFLLQMHPWAGQYTFNLYGTTITYPELWVVQSQSNSNVTFKLSTVRTLKVEFLPDASPESYVLGKFTLLEKENTQVKLLEYGPASAGNHWGYWFTSSQTNPMVSKDWQFYGMFVRIPAKSAVMTLQYINYYPNSPHPNSSNWNDDLLAIDAFLSTVSIAGDQVPARNAFGDSIRIGKTDISLFYSRNMATVAGKSGIGLRDRFDSLFTVPFSFVPVADTARRGLVACAREAVAASLQPDTTTFGADPFAVAYDTLYVHEGDSVFEQAHTYGRDPYFPGFRYSRMVKHGETLIWGSFSGPNLYLAYLDYVDAVMVQMKANGLPLSVRKRIADRMPRPAAQTLRRMLASKGVDLTGRKIHLPGPAIAPSRGAAGKLPR